MASSSLALSTAATAAPADLAASSAVAARLFDDRRGQSACRQTDGPTVSRKTVALWGQECQLGSVEGHLECALPPARYDGSSGKQPVEQHPHLAEPRSSRVDAVVRRPRGNDRQFARRRMLDT